MVIRTANRGSSSQSRYRILFASLPHSFWQSLFDNVSRTAVVDPDGIIRVVIGNGVVVAVNGLPIQRLQQYGAVVGIFNNTAEENFAVVSADNCIVVEGFVLPEAYLPYSLFGKNL